MNLRLSALLALFWLACSLPSPAAEWEEVRYLGRSHVTLASFAKFYGLSEPGAPAGDVVELKGSGRSVRFKINHREAFLNGRKVWLSFPLAQDDRGRLLLSRADVILLFDPLIRRGQTVPARPFQGVVIDPGHGGGDNGARSRSGYTEKTAALDTSLRLEKILKARGVPVVMTRRSDVFITLEERAALASRREGFVFVSMHYNSGPRQVHGVETFALSPQGTPSTSSSGRLSPSDIESQPGNRYNLHNILLTDLIHREIAGLHTPAGDRGVKRARFVVLREVRIPGVLVEGGFMSNRTDGALIESAAYRQKVAEAVARGIAAYVREVDPQHPFAQPEPAPETPPPAAPAPVPEPAPLPLKPPAPPAPLPPPAPAPPSATPSTAPPVPEPAAPPRAEETPPEPPASAEPAPAAPSESETPAEPTAPEPAPAPAPPA